MKASPDIRDTARISSETEHFTSIEQWNGRRLLGTESLRTLRLAKADRFPRVDSHGISIIAWVPNQIR